MHPQLKTAKPPIRSFMRDHYTDARLIELLAHARAGKLQYYSCCCFIGIVTATHALAGSLDYSENTSHLLKARNIPGAAAAESAFNQLFIEDHDKWFGAGRDIIRRARLIPMILAEIRRRNRIRQAQFQETEVAYGVGNVR